MWCKGITVKEVIMSDLSELLRDTDCFDPVLTLALLDEAGLVEYIIDDDYPEVVCPYEETE
jgi:hypothetical protein